MTQRDLLEALGEIDPRHLKSLDFLYRKEPMWRYVMKKSVKFAVTTAAVLLTVGVIAAAMLLQNRPQTDSPQSGGAGNQQEPLRVCADLMVGGFPIPDGSEISTKKMVENLFSDLKLYGGPEDVEIELIPGDGDARSAALTRIRTEIMSGGGPDVFLCNCVNPSASYESGKQALFPLPQQSMESGIFLPLDDSIANAQYMEWEKLTQAVMEAGKTAEGQMLLPLAYTFPLTVFRAEDVSLPDGGTTWADVVSGEDPALSATAAWAYDVSVFTVFPTQWATYSALPFGELADYRIDTLILSQQELTDGITEIASLAAKLENGELEAPPHFYDQTPAITFSPLNSLNTETSQGIYRNEELTFVPVYQKNGGAAACIRAFAGINRNTRRPEDAFFLLDRLLSQDVQENATLYTGFWDLATIPVLDDHAGLKKDFDYENEENYNAFLKAKKQITGARFSTGLDQILYDAVTECVHNAQVTEQGKGSVTVTEQDLPPEADKEKIEAVAAEAYRKMEMMIAES